jgi:hypothetical protein
MFYLSWACMRHSDLKLNIFLLTYTFLLNQISTLIRYVQFHAFLTTFHGNQYVIDLYYTYITLTHNVVVHDQPCPVFVWGPPGLLAFGSCCWVIGGLRSLNAAFPCWSCLSYIIYDIAVSWPGFEPFTIRPRSYSGWNRLNPGHGTNIESRSRHQYCILDGHVLQRFISCSPVFYWIISDDAGSPRRDGITLGIYWETT